MFSPAQRRVKLPLVTLVLALGIWIFPGSSAMAQHGGHGGGGNFGGVGHAGGMRRTGGLGNSGFGGFGGYGFYPGFYGSGYGGYGYGYGYGYPNFGSHWDELRLSLRRLWKWLRLWLDIYRHRVLGTGIWLRKLRYWRIRENVADPSWERN